MAIGIDNNAFNNWLARGKPDYNPNTKTSSIFYGLPNEMDYVKAKETATLQGMEGMYGKYRDGKKGGRRTRKGKGKGKGKGRKYKKTRRSVK